MDRFVTQMANKAVLSPTAATTIAAGSHKRSSHADDNDGHARSSPKKAKVATDDSSCLPHFPGHSLAWQPAAQTFFDSLPHSHRSPFVGLVNTILECNNLLLPSPSASTTLDPASPPQPAVPMFDSSTALVSFLDVSFVQPRGKFDVHVTDTALVLTSTGKQSSTTLVPFACLGLLVAVPDVNRKDRCILLGLLPTAASVAVGKTTLRQLLLKIDTTRKTTDPKAIRLPQPTRYALTHTTVADQLLTVLRQYCPRVSVVTPQFDTFKSTAAATSISCYHGTNDGQLYPLSTGLLFIQRPVVWVALETVDGIEVRRSGGGKVFDLKVGVKRGGEKDEVVVFGMISVMEQQALEWYVQYVARWQKTQEKEQQTKAVVDTTAAAAATAPPTSKEQGETNDDPVEQHDGSDSEADSDFDPDDGSDDDGDGAGHASDNSGGSGGEDSGSDDSQFNSDIDVDAEVDADDIVRGHDKRRRATQPTKPPNGHKKQSTSHDSDDSDNDDSEDEQLNETSKGTEQVHDDDMTSSSEEAEEAVLQVQQKQAKASGGDMSRFRNVAVADTSHSDLHTSESSADEDEVITIE